MKRTASTLGVVTALLVGSAGQAAAVGSWTDEQIPSSHRQGSLSGVSAGHGETWAFGSGNDGSTPVGDQSTTYRKDPQGWVAVPIENIGELADGAVAGSDDVWTISRKPKGGLGTSAHWDGTKWTRVDLAAPEDSSPQPQALKAFAPDDVWTVGGQWGGRGMAQHWDGRTWNDIPVPQVSSSWRLQDVEGVSSNDLWAVGETIDSYRSVALHWDGKTWTEVPIPGGNGQPGDPESLSDVLALAPDDVWVGGTTGPRNSEKPYTAHWDGKKWQVVGLGSESGRITELTRVGDEVEVFGASSANEPFALRYDGTSWRGVPAPPTGTVHAATGQDDGGILGVGGWQSGGYQNPFASTYRE